MIDNITQKVRAYMLFFQEKAKRMLKRGNKG